VHQTTEVAVSLLTAATLKAASRAPVRTDSQETDSTAQVY